MMNRPARVRVKGRPLTVSILDSGAEEVGTAILNTGTVLHVEDYETPDPAAYVLYHGIYLTIPGDFIHTYFVSEADVPSLFDYKDYDPETGEATLVSGALAEVA